MPKKSNRIRRLGERVLVDDGGGMWQAGKVATIIELEDGGVAYVVTLKNGRQVWAPETPSIPIRREHVEQIRHRRKSGSGVWRFNANGRTRSGNSGTCGNSRQRGAFHGHTI